MTNEFKKIDQGNITRYVLENASGGGTSSGSVASVSMPMGGMQRRKGDNLIAQESDKKKVPASTPRNFVAKNAKSSGAGAHKDKKKEAKQGNIKHKKPYMEALQARLDQLKSNVAEGVSLKQKHEDKKRADKNQVRYGKMTQAEFDKKWTRAERPKPTDKEQGVAEGFNGEYDDEAGMAQSNLITTARAVMGLLKTIKDRDNLPEWGQEKIAKAEMMLVSVWDYLQSQKAMGNDPQQGMAEAIVSSGDATLELLELNIFKDLIGEHSLSNYDEEFAQSPNWQKVVARWAPKAEGLYDLVIRLHNAGKKISSQEAKSITDTAYDGSDAYNDPESAASDLPRIYAQQYNAISQFIQNISNPKPTNMHEQGVAEGGAGLSKDAETNFHAKLDQLVHATFGKRKSEQGMEEDDSALNAFLSKGGKVQQLPYKKPRKADKTDYGSKHIGGGGDKMKASRTGTAAKTQGSKVVGVAEAGSPAQQAAIAIAKKKEQGVEEVKQRLDPKCWTGKHKEGTKIKGGVRVNNCVPNEGVEEGWDDIKKFGKKAAVAGAIGLGIGAANAGGFPSDVPAGGHNQLPDIVAHVKFKVGDKVIDKEINLGSHYRSPGEAGEELKNFLNSKGIKFYEYSLERVKPKADNKIDNSPAVGTGNEKPSIDTKEPASNGKNTGDYMAKEDADTYFESLQTMMERQLEPTMDLDTWVDNFQNADPQKYHQFKNKTPEKKK